LRFAMPFFKAVGGLFAAPLLAHSAGAPFFSSPPLYDCNEKVEWMPPAAKAYCCQHLAELENMRGHCRAPEESTCNRPCHYKNFNTTCGARIEWAAANEKYEDKVLQLLQVGLDQCALAQMQVRSECDFCSNCTTAETNCRDAQAELIEEKFNNVNRESIEGNTTFVVSLGGFLFLTFVVLFASRVARFKPRMDREFLITHADSDEADGRESSEADV